MLLSFIDAVSLFSPARPPLLSCPPSDIQAPDVGLAGVLRGSRGPHLAAGQAGRAGEELPPDCGAVAALLPVLVEGVVCCC